MRTIDVHLQCSSISNPPSSILWLDDQRRSIPETSIYTMKTSNQTSDLSFTVVRSCFLLLGNNKWTVFLYVSFQSPEDQPTVTFYCRSNNSIGTDEKLIDISSKINHFLWFRLLIWRFSLLFRSRRLRSNYYSWHSNNNNDKYDNDYQWTSSLRFFISNDTKLFVTSSN